VSRARASAQEAITGTAPALRGGARFDAAMMARALREARKGSPSPNPHVGAVITRGKRIIAVGHHERCGGPHAEIDALQRAGARARGATLYVTFEPCNHHGRTGPCTEAIIAAGLARVVVGCADPAPHKPGSRARLRRAGVAVEIGVRKAEAEALIADFAKHMLRKLPYVTLKAAVTLDGRMAARSGESKWITSEAARRQAHRMRANSDAVLVGVETVLHDDPELSVRLVRGKHPLRVVLDSRLRTPERSKLARVTPELRTLIFHGPRASKQKRARLAARGVELFEVGYDARGRLHLRDVLRELARRDVVRLLVEGGSRVHGALLDAGLVDRVAVFVAPRLLGDAAARPLADRGRALTLAQALALESLDVQRFGPDLLIEGSVTSAARR
jgi:diaminohydroxyphosphoribosylaminopyrimidine deaminase/5-amino-6-(5-phosphoribosylamino)uracil reductase